MIGWSEVCSDPIAVTAGLFAFGCAVAEPGRDILVILPTVTDTQCAMDAAVSKDLDSFLAPWTRNTHTAVATDRIELLQLTNQSNIFFRTPDDHTIRPETLNAVVIGDFQGNSTASQGSALEPFCLGMRRVLTRVCELSIPCITMCHTKNSTGHSITPRFTWPPF